MFLRIVAFFMIVLGAALNLAAQQKPAAAPALADFRISGTLVDAITGQPLAHARVAITPATERDNFTTMITAEDGRFSFSNVAAGKYTLTAQTRGYLLQSFNQHDQFSSSIVVGPGLDSGDLLFQLPPESSISGVVLDEAGEPVRDAQVMLYLTGLAAGLEATRLRNRVITDDEGAYHFRHLAPGRYLVAVAAKPWYAQHSWPGSDGMGMVVSAAGGSGFVSSSSSVSVTTTAGGYAGSILSSTGSGESQSNPQLDVAYPITFNGGVTDAATATPIVLGRGEKATADINLQPVPALHLRVSTETADAERGTYMVLERPVLDGPAIQVPTEIRGGGHQGSREIVGLAPGHYTVRTYTTGRAGPAERTESREIDVSDNGEIDKDQGSANVPVTATLQYESGSPGAHSLLRLLNKKTREGAAERISGDGEIVFKQGVRPGDYELSMPYSPGVYPRSITATGAKVTGRTIAIRSGSAVKIAITAVRGEGEITGTALRDGKPFAGAMIVLVPADPVHNQVLFRRDQSDSDGTFTLPEVIPGAYTLLALEKGWDLEWANPDALRPYMAGAIAVQAQSNGKYNLKVPVQ